MSMTEKSPSQNNLKNQASLRIPQQPVSQIHQQANGIATAQFQDSQAADAGGPSGKLPQVKVETPVIKTEPGTQEQHLGQQQATAGPSATEAPAVQNLQGHASTGQVGQPASGGFPPPTSLVASQRVVADYTGPGQGPAGPQPNLGTGHPQNPGFHPQQGLPQGLSTQEIPLQTSASGAGHISAGHPIPTAVYPSHGQGTAQVPKPVAAPSSSSNGKQVSTSDIQRVQNYIEKCLQMYLTQKEVISQLQQQFRIEPCFTQLVWQKLEEQNQEFFRAYYTRLKLKDQIVLFNHLLDEQVKMFDRLPRSSNMMQGASGPLMNAHSGMGPGLQYQPLHPVPQHQSHAPSSVSGLRQATSMSGQAPSSEANLALSDSAHHLDAVDFPELGMDGSSEELNPDLAALAQSLPFSGSEMNLAGMISSGSMGRGLGSQDHLAGLPRNFSLSDLGLDHVMDGENGGMMPRNISLSDFPALDLDSGGEQS